MFTFCQYKDVLGKPREGFHRYRFFGVALVDLSLTVIVALLLSWLFNRSLISTLVYFFLIGQLLHILFCVNTSFVNNVLGLYY